jgi:hypothetical protein
MTNKTALVALALSAGFASMAIAAPPQGAPDQAAIPSASGPLTPPRIPTRCQTDLSIENITIRQTSNPSVLTLSVSVINLGPGVRFEAPAGLINVRLQTLGNIRGRRVPTATQFSREDITTVDRGPRMAFDFEIPSGPPTSQSSQIVAALNVGPDGPPSACDANSTNDSLIVPASRLLPWLARRVGVLSINRGF